MDERFSTEVKTTHVVQIEGDGVFTHGDLDPTQLEISVVDDEGSLHVLAFEGDTLFHLASIVRGLVDAFPDVFGSRKAQESF